MTGDRQRGSRVTVYHSTPLIGQSALSNVSKIIERVADQEPDGQSNNGVPRGPGRTLGSTNYSREAFWETYAQAVRPMTRPYSWTGVYAATGIRVDTLRKYLAKWGPPPGHVSPRQ